MSCVAQVLPKTPNMYLLSLIAAAAGRHLDCRLIQTSVPNLYVVVMGKNLDAATPAPQDPPETRCPDSRPTERSHIRVCLE